ncbi:MAG TPA: ribonuclease III [bacterium]|nr:ribonuclease III [bacterium]
MSLDRKMITELEKKLSYFFKDTELLERAFTHPSADTSGIGHYQRLEFLGDEVVGLGVSKLLYETFPDAEEGKLSKARSNLIDEAGLAFNAKGLDLGELLILGKGEEKMEGRAKDSILADAFESLMAVIFIESGWDTAFKIITDIFTPLINASPDIEDLLNHINRDYKTRLQEIAQELELPLPIYAVKGREGPEHELFFTIECTAMGFSTTGSGRNKKAAEQDAAMKILKEMRVL